MYVDLRPQNPSVCVKTTDAPSKLTKRRSRIHRHDSYHMSSKEIRTMSTNNFILSRATEHDFAELINVEFDTFTDPVIQEAFMASDDSAGRESLLRQRLHVSRADPNDVWMKVVDRETGRIAGASNWKVFAGAVPEQRIEVDLEWLGERGADKRERAEGIWKATLEARRRNMVEACVCKYRCRS